VWIARFLSIIGILIDVYTQTVLYVYVASSNTHHASFNLRPHQTTMQIAGEALHQSAPDPISASLIPLITRMMLVRNLARDIAALLTVARGITPITPRLTAEYGLGVRNRIDNNNALREPRQSDNRVILSEVSVYQSWVES
jgi:hypothetical protein